MAEMNFWCENDFSENFPLNCKRCGWNADKHYVGNDVLEQVRKYKQCPVCGHEINTIKGVFYERI